HRLSCRTNAQPLRVAPINSYEGISLCLVTRFFGPKQAVSSPLPRRSACRRNRYKIGCFLSEVFIGKCFNLTRGYIRGRTNDLSAVKLLFFSQLSQRCRMQVKTDVFPIVC